MSWYWHCDWAVMGGNGSFCVPKSSSCEYVCHVGVYFDGQVEWIAEGYFEERLGSYRSKVVKQLSLSETSLRYLLLLFY